MSAQPSVKPNPEKQGPDVTLEFQKNGEWTKVQARPTTLVNGGCGLLYMGLISVGAVCKVTFTTSTGNPLVKPGHVTRCMHVRNGIYEIGIDFDEPIGGKKTNERVVDPVAEQLQAIYSVGIAGMELYQLSKQIRRFNDLERPLTALVQKWLAWRLSQGEGLSEELVAILEAHQAKSKPIEDAAA